MIFSTVSVNQSVIGHGWSSELFTSPFTTRAR